MLCIQRGEGVGQNWVYFVACIPYTVGLFLFFFFLSLSIFPLSYRPLSTPYLKDYLLFKKHNQVQIQVPCE